MFINVLNSSIAAVWLILAVTVLRLIFRRAPRWAFCVMWALVGVRLVCPFSVRSLFSLIPSAQTIPPTIEYDAVPQIQSGVGFINNSVNPVLSDSFAATPYNSANPMQIVMELFRYLWVAGMIVMVIYLAVSWLVLRIRLRTATRLRDNIMQSERVTSPFVMGIIRPRIYLPYGLEENSSRSIIAHEQAHIARFDHVTKPAAFLVLTLHWFNPFVWLAYILLCRDIESACDQRVVREMTPDERKDYSRTLVTGGRKRLAAACPLAFGEVNVKNRVKSVLSYKKPTLWVIIAAAAVCAVIALCFLTDPIERHDPFGATYSAGQTVYVSAGGSANEILRADSIILTADRRVYGVYDGVSSGWGRLEESDLTKENFDRYFYNEDGWWADISAAQLRRGNQSAWRLTGGNGLMIYVLQQRSGEVYLAAGWYDSEGETDYYSDDSSIACVISLIKTADSAADLDSAIDAAAVSFNEGKFYEGEFRCAVHTLLATECEETDDPDVTRLTAYAIVLYNEYTVVDGRPYNCSGSSIPAAITFDITRSGEYTLVEYWEPQDGTMFVTSLKEKYPDGVSWDTTVGHREREAQCLALAYSFFGIEPDYTVTTSGGADYPEMVYTTASIVVSERRYSYESEQLIGECTLLLGADGRAELTFGGLSSYIAWGSYSHSDGVLTITTDDQIANTYRFTQTEDGGWMFDAEHSSSVPAFKPSYDSEPVDSIPDGAIFTAQ